MEEQQPVARLPGPRIEWRTRRAAECESRSCVQHNRPMQRNTENHGWGLCGSKATGVLLATDLMIGAILRAIPVRVASQNVTKALPSESYECMPSPARDSIHPARLALLIAAVSLCAFGQSSQTPAP